MKGRLNPVDNGQNLVQNPAFLYAIEQGKIKIYVNDIWPVIHMKFISKSMGLKYKRQGIPGSRTEL